MPTFDPKRILCPVDFSEHSAAALRVAGGVAKAFGAEVSVLHAQRMEVPVYFTAAQTKALQAQLRRSRKTARDFVMKFAGEHLPEEVSREVQLTEDDPVLSILRTAKQSKAGLLVMGTHGRSGLERIRLGSVTESVLRQTSAPMLTVGPAIKPTRSLGLIRRIICPVSFTEADRSTIEHAAALAEKTGAELVPIHVLETGAAVDSAAEQAKTKLCEWIPPAVRDRCTLREVVRQGHVGEQLVAEARESRADLMVVSAHPRSLLGTILFGSTTEFVIRNAGCPVLSVVHK